MTYYKGTLELMTPLPEHETYSWTLSRLVVALGGTGFGNSGFEIYNLAIAAKAVVRKQTSVSTSKRSRSSR